MNKPVLFENETSSSSNKMNQEYDPSSSCCLNPSGWSSSSSSSMWQMDDSHKFMAMHRRLLPYLLNTSTSTADKKKGSSSSPSSTAEAASRDIDALMAKEMSELSIKERQSIAKEIDGVDTAILPDETPEFISCKLNLLEEELGKLKGHALRNAYDLALSIDSVYVTDHSFRLMFLRRERYNVPKAALGLMRHFEYKLELFGKDKIARPIRFEDLSQDDRLSLECGCVQFLGAKDIKGRAIGFCFPGMMEDVTWQSNHRARWYQVMSMMEDDESVQRNGVVYVTFGSPNRHFRGAKEKLKMLQQALPTRPVAYHCCYFEQQYTNHFYSLQPLARVFFLTLGRSSRVRVRIHLEDSPIRILYILQSHGINPKDVPLGDDGIPQTKKFLNLIHARHQKELQQQQLQQLQQQHTFKFQVLPHPQQAAPTPILTNKSTFAAIVPSEHDVLLGQGHKHRNHVGNLVLETFIEQELNAFRNATSRFEKTCVVLRVVQNVKESGGRFLIRSKHKPPSTTAATTDTTSPTPTTTTASNLNAPTPTITREWVEAKDSVTHDGISCRFRSQLRKGTTVVSKAANDTCPKITPTTATNLDSVSTAKTTVPHTSASSSSSSPLSLVPQQKQKLQQQPCTRATPIVTTGTNDLHRKLVMELQQHHDVCYEVIDPYVQQLQEQVKVEEMVRKGLERERAELQQWLERERQHIRQRLRKQQTQRLEILQHLKHRSNMMQIHSPLSLFLGMIGNGNANLNGRSSSSSSSFRTFH